MRELVHMDDLFEWSRGLRSIVVGLDPFEVAANHARMLHDTQYHGRRGLGIHAISAVDIALYDLAGKQLDRPAYQLLGGACREKLRPYATIWPGSPNGRTIGEVMDNIAELFEKALALGFAATVQECREWLERGKVDVLQPDVNRCGGLTELRRIAELAFHHGAEVVPHGWKTGITAAAQRHFQAATPCCPLIETCHPELCEWTLRSSLTGI